MPPPVVEGAVASLVLGILSVWIWPAGFVLGPLAIIFSRRARRSLAENPNQRGSGLATAGLATGIVGTCLSAALIVLFVFLVAFAFSLAPGSGGPVVAVTAALHATNLDEDPERELAVLVTGWGEGMREFEARPLDGTVHVVVHAGTDGNWSAIANRTQEVDGPDWANPLHTLLVAFPQVEVDEGQTFRAEARYVARDGSVFDGRSKAMRGEDLEDP